MTLCITTMKKPNLKYLSDLLTGPCYPLNCNCDDCRPAKHRAEVAAVLAIWFLLFLFGGIFTYFTFFWTPAQ